MKVKEDVELRAIRTIINVLEDLDDLARSRVIGYVRSRLFGARDDIFRLCSDSEKEADFVKLDEEDACEG